MLSNALKGDGNMPEGVYKPVEEIAELIEDTIFKKFKETNMKYKNQIRSRVFNLRDKKNPALRENVLCGVIMPDKFAFMKSEEMASDEARPKTIESILGLILLDFGIWRTQFWVSCRDSKSK